MNIVVLMKEVPNMDMVKFDSERGVIDRTSADGEINPFDLNALQTAVDLRKKTGGKITVITMGPPKAAQSLRDAYSRGGDELILLTDRRFGGSDTWATSYTLGASLKKIQSFDLIICGEKSVDGDTAQVGAEVAEFLDLPHAYYVEKIIGVDDKAISVEIENLGDMKQTREMSLPCLISVTKNINFPELPSLKRKLESLKVDVNTLSLDDLNGLLTEDKTGFKGSPTKVSKIVIPKEISRESQLFRHDKDGFLEAVKSAMHKRNLTGVNDNGCKK
ncbi:MAG: electron transfer flavoprotein subunit beta/FixA family protein [Dethiosulfatibacter sp.]|nr:electron transfer flavoprotein subunit beta/FixA family protein [Dethiosulfatibacter sp.]